MRLRVLVLTTSRDLCDFAGRKKQGLIPKDIRERDYFASARIAVQAMRIDAVAAATEVGRLVQERSEDTDAVVVLFESSLAAGVDSLATSCFLWSFPLVSPSRDFGNHISRALSRCLRAFEVFSRRFDELQYQKMFLLPTRNFRAGEFEQLKACFTVREGDFNFSSELEQALSALRGRQKPKVQTTDRRVYYVDARNLFFEYGCERHGSFDTAEPHDWQCALNGCFRFGRRIERERHFNVTCETGDLSHDFVDCHDGEISVRRSHANIFPNDFVS
jgi:hypothetical protein